jgi:hypothetical protein
MMPSDLRAQRQLRHAICATLNCRKRKGLIPTKTMVFGLLVEIDLCEEHEAEHHAALHEQFREHFDMDFVDPERN